MWATNYYNKNASRVFSLEPDFSDENFESWNICLPEEEEYTREQFEELENEQFYNFVLEDVASSIVEELKCKNISEWSESENYPVDRNYPATFFGEVSHEKQYSDGRLETYRIELCYRSGYYEWVNFDYDIIREVNRDEWYYTDYVDELSPYMEKKLQKEIKKIEQAYSKFTEPLEVVGRFSNGETVYRKVTS